jgi:hypothetical protein
LVGSAMSSFSEERGMRCGNKDVIRRAKESGRGAL